MKRAVLSSLASASALALAVAAGPALAGPEAGTRSSGTRSSGTGSPGNSAAEITLEDCLLESSKDISYVAFFADGEELDKDESIDGESFDLTTVEGIEDYEAVEVKSGTTVEDSGSSAANSRAQSRRGATPPHRNGS